MTRIRVSLFAAVVVACAGPISAAPILQFVDNFDSTATLQVVTDASGALGAEVAVEVATGPGLVITSVVVDTANFDTANPGDNPFIPGSPIGGDTIGLWTNLSAGQAFAAYGSGNLGIGTFDFLTLTYEGEGQLSAFGLVAQGASLNEGLSAQIAVDSDSGTTEPLVPEPSAVMLISLGLIGSAFRRCR